ncbi:beta strand repeat-containing protein [uncultured Sphingomonas sp.]|uniref:beta strand repeat-containing protein n=1 Tax=uncultured Sphingomonas sp. TaxID=158754 RepID=UPI0035CA5D96
MGLSLPKTNRPRYRSKPLSLHEASVAKGARLLSNRDDRRMAHRVPTADHVLIWVVPSRERLYPAPRGTSSMHNSVKPFLLGGVAATALTVGCVGAAPAAAQCVTSGSTVTCNGATTDGQAQQAIDGATPPNLTFNINAGARIATVQRQIYVPNSASVAINNAGVIGTSPTVTTDLSVAGASRSTGVNSGVVNGSVSVGSQFGSSPGAGAGSFANTGTVTGTVSLQGSGDQSYTGGGAMQGGPYNYYYFNALTLASRASTTTTAADGTRTTSVTGGLASATVDGVLRSPGTQPNFLGVSVTGIGGSTVGIGGTTGGVTVSALDANTVFRSTYSYQVQNSASTNVNNSQAVGGAATLTVSSGATVNGTSSVTGLTIATASVNGAMLPGGQLYGSPLLTVTANAADTAYSNSQTSSGFGANASSSYQGANTSTSRGGTASVTVGTGANVAGGVSVIGGSTAGATVNGAISSTSGSSYYVSNLAVTAGAADSTSSYSSRSDPSGSSSTSSASTTQRGGAASVTIGEIGSVAGAVQVNGITNASATIAGTVGTAQTPGGVSVVAQGSDTTSSGSSFSTGTTGSNSTSANTNTSRAGAASALVTATGRVAGGVGVSGGTSATATIDGVVGSTASPFGGVFVSAYGTDGTTTTTSTSSAGGANYTQTQDSSSSARGGPATVMVSATGSVIGSVSAGSNRGPATATLAGRAGVANAQNYSPAPSLSATATGVDTRSTSTSGPNRNAYSNSSTAVGGQATATILAGGVMSGDVVATGDAGAMVVNAGSVTGALRAAAGAANTVNSSDSTGSATTSGGVTTSTNQSNPATPARLWRPMRA